MPNLDVTKRELFCTQQVLRVNVILVQSRWERAFSIVFLPCPISFVKDEILLYFLHMFSYEFHFLGYCYNLVGYELNRDTNDASTLFICVPI